MPAILFGFQYTGEQVLPGAVADVTNWQAFYQSRGITTTCIDDVTKPMQCSKLAVMQLLYKEAVESHDRGSGHLYVHFSGHGLHRQDDSGDELDGRDEGILLPEGTVLWDDEIYRWLDSIGKNTRVTLVVDTCYSGTIADQKYQHGAYLMHNASNRRPRPSNRAPVVTFASSGDSQTASEMVLDGQVQGAFSYAMIKVLEDNLHVDGLVDRVNAILRSKGLTQRACMHTNGLGHVKLFVA